MAPPRPAAPPPSQAERRQLTVMFCDMVGSSALSTQLDPEVHRDVVASFQEACAREIKRFDGMVAQYLGDGVLAYFGYPAAHEDDAERAVRAGLAILSGVPVLRPAPGVRVQARIGIASGIVVVGDLVRQGVTQENAAIGETTNLAARLQALAEPDTLVIAPETHRLVGALFEYRDLGFHALKGFAMPVDVREVLRASAVENRFEARQREGASPLLGRGEELDLLMRRWRQVKEGEGRVVLVSGEPGIGKSRLTRALLQNALASEPHTPLVYHCSPYHQESALYPVIGQVLRAAGIERGDTSALKLGKLTELLTLTSADLDTDLGLFAALLSIADGPALPDLTPQQIKERTLAALLARLQKLCARQPVLLLFEDLHWIDPSSLELLTRLVERAANMALLVLATARPEFEMPWPNHRHVWTMALSRLGPAEGRALIDGMTGGKELPREVLDEIITRTDGVPLFMEELTKTVLESGLLREAGDSYELCGPLPPLAIPSTLHASLLARLDRLASVKEIAQIGAVLGREFPYRLLSAIAALPEHELKSALDQLVDAGLIFQRGAPPDASYQFKHALVQDVAYSSLVRARRQELHSRVASAMERISPEIAAIEPELLAYHCEQAGLTDKAIRYWHGAGKRARSTSANIEAIRHFSNGLRLLATSLTIEERKGRELQLQIDMGSTFVALKGQASKDVEMAFVRARELCDQKMATSELASILFGLWRCYVSRSEMPAATEFANALLQLPRKIGDLPSYIIAGYAAGFTHFLNGELRSACEELDVGCRGQTENERASVIGATGQDLGTGCLIWSALPLSLLGYPEKANGRVNQGLRLASCRSDKFSLSFARSWAACVSQLGRDAEATLKHADAAVSLGHEQGFPVWVAMGRIFRGWALAMQDNVADGIILIDQGIADWRSTGAALLVPYYYTMLAEVYARSGQPDRALQILDEAAGLAEALRQRWWDAEVLRLRGEFLLQKGGSTAPEAETSFVSALQIAQHQHAKALELRAATSLGRLWRDDGRCGAARELVAPVCDWFTEGFDTADLKEARTLLDELA